MFSTGLHPWLYAVAPLQLKNSTFSSVLGPPSGLFVTPKSGTAKESPFGSHDGFTIHATIITIFFLPTECVRHSLQFLDQGLRTKCPKTSTVARVSIVCFSLWSLVRSPPLPFIIWRWMFDVGRSLLFLNFRISFFPSSFDIFFCLLFFDFDDQPPAMLENTEKKT